MNILSIRRFDPVKLLMGYGKDLINFINKKLSVALYNNQTFGVLIKIVIN